MWAAPTFGARTHGNVAFSLIRVFGLEEPSLRLWSAASATCSQGWMPQK